jgi:hypothetical protein
MPARRPWGALRHPDRWLAAVCVAVGGLTHVPLIQDHLEEAPYIGVLFIALAVVAVVLAVALLVADSPLVWAVTVVVMAAAVAAFLVSRTAGLPQMPDDVGNWRGEAMGLPAVTSEALATLLGLTVLVRTWLGRRTASPVVAPTR